MTRVDFMPDDQVTITQEVDIPPDEFADFVRSGQWQAPAPYTAAAHNAWLRVIQQGKRVVIVALNPLNPDETPHTETILLSPRMEQVLKALAGGLTTKEIAHQLKLHPRTVALHIARIKALLGSTTLAQTVAKAAALGLCPPPKK